MTSFLVDFSNELANAVEQAGAFVIAVEEGGREGVSGLCGAMSGGDGRTHHTRPG